MFTSVDYLLCPHRRSGMGDNRCVCDWAVLRESECCRTYAPEEPGGEGRSHDCDRFSIVVFVSCPREKAQRQVQYITDSCFAAWGRVFEPYLYLRFNDAVTFISFWQNLNVTVQCGPAKFSLSKPAKTVLGEGFGQGTPHDLPVAVFELVGSQIPSRLKC